MIAVTGVTSLIYFPSKFTSVVIFCMIAAIIFPLWLSSFLHARTEIEREKPISFKKKMSIHCQTFLSAFLKPMLIMNSYEETQEDVKSAITRGADANHVLELLKKGHQLKVQYGNFLIIDLGIGRFK